MLTQWLSRGARRMLGELPPEPLSLFNKTVAGRNATASKFDIDISNATKLWLIAQDFGSNAPERVEPLWAGAELVGADGASTPLVVVDAGRGAGPAECRRSRTGRPGRRTTPVTFACARRRGWSTTSAGRGFTRFRGSIALDNPRSEIGSTLNPAVRFFVFDVEPNMDRLLPPAPQPPLPAGPTLATVSRGRRPRVPARARPRAHRLPNGASR